MWGTERTPSETGVYPTAGVNQKTNNTRSKQHQKNAIKVRKSTNDFLTSSFKPIPVIECDTRFSSDNYTFLFESAKNYCSMIDKEFDLVPDGKSFRKLYETFNRLLPNKQILYIVEEEGRLQYKIVQSMRDNTLYYIPACILNKTKGRLKNITACFLQHLHRSQKLDNIKNTYHWESFENDYEEYRDSEELDEEYLGYLKDYLHGKISKYLDLATAKPTLELYELVDLIQSYKPRRKKDRELIELIEEGIYLLDQNKCIMHYAEAPEGCNEECEPIRADELIMIIYDDDIICQYMIENVNTSSQESDSEYFSCGELLITPDTEMPFEADDYAIHFIEWLAKFIAKLYEY